MIEKKYVACGVCRGTGITPNYPGDVPCIYCNGSGQNISKEDYEKWCADQEKEYKQAYPDCKPPERKIVDDTCNCCGKPFHRCSWSHDENDD